jgi:hypothetical protein
MAHATFYGQNYTFGTVGPYNSLNLGSNVGHKVIIIIFFEITKLYTKLLLLFTNATDPYRNPDLH